jgi:peroxin-3
VLEELQKQKAERLSRSVGPSEIASSAPPSVADTTEDDARSSSLQTDSFVHTSQVVTEGDATGLVEGASGASDEKKSKKSKAQLWNEMKISCTYCSLYIETRS